MRGFNSDAALFSRPERLALLVAGLISPFPVNVILFISNAVLCLVSSIQVLTSGLKERTLPTTGRKTPSVQGESREHKRPLKRSAGR